MSAHIDKPSQSHTFADKLRVLSGHLAGAAILIIVVVVAGLFPRIRFSVWAQLPIYAVPLIVSAIFTYRRALHPDRVPPQLASDAPPILKLKRIKKFLGWSMFAWLFVGAAAVIFACSCACNGPVSIGEYFILAIVTVPPVLGSIAFQALTQYIKERTVQPIIRTSLIPVAVRNMADYKPFYSEQWGHPTTQATGHRMVIQSQD